LDYEATLGEINRSLGNPPRKPDHGDKYHFEPWCYANFGWFARIGFDEILRRGDVVWAALIQANYALFEHDAELSNYPATVVYSRELKHEPQRLVSVAEQLYAAKGKSLPDSDLTKIGAALANERMSTARLPVPDSIAGGVQCAMTEVAFDRRHMPRGVLAARLFPILVHRKWRWAVLVPFWHWPDEYREEHWSLR
jgi:hypothetical protein